eukprot:Hpha_TRINITY_DN16362_c1_g1::TRINITY_DN16362_c1_g1_i2::g.59495::m.59495
MSCFYACVDESEKGVKQSMGKFDEIVDSGCHCLTPCQSITPVSMMIHQLIVHTDTKTSDDVTVTVSSAIQWCVDEDLVETFYFKVTNPEEQVSAFVDDIIRSELPIRTLDAAFAEKETMGKSAEESLRRDVHKTFGIYVVRVLIVDLQPDQKVLDAMNEINAAKREREAARERAEAQRVLTVVAAEAEKDARQLSGQGLALMRREIASGFKNSIVDLTGDKDDHLNAESVVHMMLVTQYLDVLKDFAQSGGASMVVPHGGGVTADIESQVRNGFWQSTELGNKQG